MHLASSIVSNRGLGVNAASINEIEVVVVVVVVVFGVVAMEHVGTM